MNPPKPPVNRRQFLRDGARAVEVSALFEEAVIEVRHFDDPSGGQVTSAT